MGFSLNDPEFVPQSALTGTKDSAVSKGGKIIRLSEADLVRHLINRERVGHIALYNMYAASLYGVILRIVNHREIAEELLQDTFVKICEHCNLYDPSKGRFFTWIMSIARNLSIDKVRTKGFKKSMLLNSIEESKESLDSFQSNAFNVETIGIKTLVNNMNPKYKLIIDMIYFKGYTHLEASVMLDLPLGTIKTRLRSGILILRKMI